MWVLTVLQAGPRHLARLLDDVRAIDGPIGHGTLFAALARLERLALIESSRRRGWSPGVPPHGARRGRIRVGGCTPTGGGPMSDQQPELGRFAEPSLYILISLSDGPKHGYAIMADIERVAGSPMGPGTLYGALARLERRGLSKRSTRSTPPSVPAHRARRHDARGPVAAPAIIRRDGAGTAPREGNVSGLLRLYPRPWRERYGEEFEELLAQRPPSVRHRLDIARGALDAHLHPQLVDPDRVVDRWWLAPLAGFGLLIVGVLVVAASPERSTPTARTGKPAWRSCRSSVLSSC